MLRMVKDEAIGMNIKQVVEFDDIEEANAYRESVLKQYPYMGYMTSVMILKDEKKIRVSRLASCD